MTSYKANERLCQIMDSKQYNATDIIKLTGWNAPKVSRILNNKRELTSSEIQKLSEVLNVSVDDFFGHSFIISGNNNGKSLSSQIVDAGKLYASSNRGEFKDSEVGKMIRKELPELISRKINIDSRNYKIEGSIGKGQYAEVAWISIFDKSITVSATRGIYIVFLYSVDGKSVYLSLNQGYTYFGEKFSPKEARNELRNMATLLRRNIKIKNTEFIDTIDLGAKKSLGRGYEAGHIIGKKYDFDQMPSDDDLIRDIYDLITIYQSIKTLFSKRSVEEFYDYLVEKEKGNINLITVEKEVNTSNALKPNKSIIDDVPKPKKEAVIDDKGVRRYPRDPQVAANALSQEDYLCVYNRSHFTFKAKGSEHMYVEAHHLIPLKESDRFGENSIDVEANIVSLCSVCHDCIHHGTNEDKEKIIKNLYEKRKERLKKAGIYVSLELLLEFYGIKKK